MMHEHDSHLIAAIAVGDLGAEEQAAAEARLEGCPVCTTDLQLQTEALAFLRTSPPIMMTDLERVSLHRSVAENLPPVSSPAVGQTKMPWFQRLMPAMAAAAALVAVVGVGSILVSGSGDADMAAGTTAAATAGNAEMAPAAEELAEDAGGTALADGGEETTTTISFAAPGLAGIQEYGDISATDLEDIATQLKTLEAADDQSAYSRESLQGLPIEPALVCDDQALGEGSIIAIGRARVDGEDVEIYRIDELVDVYSAADCILLDRFD